ncbi:putative Diaminopimelate decarboxylase [Rhodotorula toruloides]|nr:putative Diaminopimelate decarboxylase [Rhodotorula toruloides]
MTALTAPRSSWPLQSDAASSISPSLAETAPPSPRTPTRPTISAPRPRRVQLVAPGLDDRPFSQAASDGGDSTPRRTLGGSAKARAQLLPNRQDDWRIHSASCSDAGATLSPSPLRWTSSSGASSLGTVVYEDWPVPVTSVPRLLFSPPPQQPHDTIETAPKPVQPVDFSVEAEDERSEPRKKRWSLYTIENVERLREEEDGALLVWLDFPSLPDDVFTSTLRPPAMQRARLSRLQGFYLTPPSRQTPLTSPISLASARAVDASVTEDDFAFLPTSPVTPDRMFTPTPVETGCSLLHVLPWRKRRRATSSPPSEAAHAPITSLPPEPAHLSISRTTSPGFLALLGRSPPVPESELVARPSPVARSFDGENVPLGPQGYRRVVVPRPDVKPGRQPRDLPPPPRPPSPRRPPLRATQMQATPVRDTELIEAGTSRRDKGKGRAVGWALG